MNSSCRDPSDISTLGTTLAPLGYHMPLSPRCDAMRCDAMRCDAMRCDAIAKLVPSCWAVRCVCRVKQSSKQLSMWESGPSGVAGFLGAFAQTRMPPAAGRSRACRGPKPRSRFQVALLRLRCSESTNPIGPRLVSIAHQRSASAVLRSLAGVVCRPVVGFRLKRSVFYLSPASPSIPVCCLQLLIPICQLLGARPCLPSQPLMRRLHGPSGSTLHTTGPASHPFDSSCSVSSSAKPIVVISSSPGCSSGSFSSYAYQWGAHEDMAKLIRKIGKLQESDAQVVLAHDDNPFSVPADGVLENV
ncbi:hypothetical protein BT67DRAFT_438524 [Trichocladium antarcticum]|uniref:Uncharacterized protein n=1 Tax=Trichocladium antarcticum TaxID=1450529 RepID=A0AAN6UQM7_9PEZI|nr:hypothetical protein BT67DRAFT_438524 [Trichocladium antarcticum]